MLPVTSGFYPFRGEVKRSSGNMKIVLGITSTLRLIVQEGEAVFADQIFRVEFFSQDKSSVICQPTYLGG